MSSKPGEDHPVDLIELRLREVAAFPGFTSDRCIDLPVDGSFQDNEIGSAEPVAVEVLAFGVDTSRLQNASGFGFHPHIKARALRLTLPGFRNRNGLQALESLFHLVCAITLFLKSFQRCKCVGVLIKVTPYFAGARKETQARQSAQLLARPSQCFTASVPV